MSSQFMLTQKQVDAVQTTEVSSFYSRFLGLQGLHALADIHPIIGLWPPTVRGISPEIAFMLLSLGAARPSGGRIAPTSRVETGMSLTSYCTTIAYGY